MAAVDDAETVSDEDDLVIFYPAVTSAHVTTLEFFGSLLLAGEGSHLCVYDTKSRELIHQQQVLKGNNVHGIRINSSFQLGSWHQASVFGGKSLSVLRLCSPTPSSILFDVLTSVFTFEDWIWDALWYSDSSNEEEAAVLALALGHNVVVLWDWKLGCVIQSIHCEETCILYSAALLGSSSDSLAILAGTVFHDVIIWCGGGSSEIGVRRVLHRLQGHEGVIFSVAYNACLQLICSTSDDRSVRLWSVIMPSLSGSQLTWSNWASATIHSKAVLYGHTARVWKAIPLGHCVVSAGEDSLLCIWDYRGSVIHKVHAHNGGKIWSIAVDEQEAWVASGGSDAGIQLWPVSHAALTDSRTPVAVPLPFDSTNDDQLTAKDFSRTVALLDIDRLLVMTNEGILYCHSTKTNDWSILVNDSTYRSYSVMVPAPWGRHVALGSISGQLLIIDTDGRDGSITAFQCVRQQIYSDKVLAITWLNHKHLLTCGTQGNMLLWYFCSSNGCLQLMLHSDFLLPDCKQRWISAATFLPRRSRIVCGDRAGSIHVYAYDREGLTSDQPINVPIQSLRNIHSGITDVQEQEGVVYTAGRDGQVKIFALKEWGLEETRSIKVSNSLDWISRLAFIKGTMYILGFHRKEFVVWSWEQKCSILSLPCGGGHRSWDFKMNDTDVRLIYIRGGEVFHCHIDNCFHIPFILRPSLHGRRICSLLHLFSVTRETGELNICATASEDNSIKIIAFACNERWDMWHLVCTLHGHNSSVRALAACWAEKKTTTEAVDGSTNNPTDLLLFSAGGRAQIKVWRISADSNEVFCHSQLLASHMLRASRKHARKPWKMQGFLVDEPETRYMDFTVVAINRIDDTLPSGLYIAAGACSDGFVRLFGFDEDTKELKLLNLLTFHEHCVLRVKHLTTANRTLLLLSAATDGRVAFWDVTEIALSYAQTQPILSGISDEEKASKRHGTLMKKSSSSSEKSLPGDSTTPCRPFHSLHLHQSGINSLLVHEITGDVFLLATGGDDNALHLVVFKIIINDQFVGIDVIASCSAASAHAAQITEIKSLPRNMLISASVDQRIQLWHWRLNQTDVTLRLLASRLSTVADVAAMDVWADSKFGGQDFHTICVAGEGFQLFRCYLPHPHLERLI